MEKTRPEFYDPAKELVEIATAFRHLRGDSKRERDKGTTRRHQHARMEELERRFETLLARWMPDPEARTMWRAHLHEGSDVPSPPAPPRTLLFKGRVETGPTVAVYGNTDGTQEVLVDGHPATRPYGRVDLDDRPRPLHIFGRDFAECCDAPEAAINALRVFFAAPSGAPPWVFARPLLDEGLIDRDFSITARGRRLLAGR
jgi:hypothetical protein